MALTSDCAGLFQTHHWEEADPSLLVGHDRDNDQYVRIKVDQSGCLIVQEAPPSVVPPGGGLENEAVLVTGVPTLVIPQRLTRMSATLYNGGPDILFLGSSTVVPFDGSGAPSQGVPLPVGGYYAIVDSDNPYDLYATCFAAGTAHVVYLETYS